MRSVIPQKALFDVQQIRPIVFEVIRQCLFFEETDQISMRVRPENIQLDPATLYQDGIGSLYNFQDNTWKAREEDFNTLHPSLKETYLEKLIDSVEKAVSGRLGRARIMRLKPKRCYSWHRDPDQYRLHIPLVTNEACFYLTQEGGMEQMMEVGRLYMVRTNVHHTALNTSNEDRIHLVFSTY